MRKRIVAMFLTVIMAGTLAAGCGGSGNGGDGGADPQEKAQDKTGEKILHLDGGNPETLDSLLGTSGNSVGVIREVMEGLGRFVKKDGQDIVEPAGAESWETSEDGLTWTFHLRDHNWSDGEPVTAKDYIYAFQRMFSKDVVSSGTQFFLSVENAQDIIDGKKEPEDLGATAPDDKTVVITLKESSSPFMAILSTVEAAIVPADAPDLQTDPVGTGPYRFVSRSLQENVVLERFDDYWGEPAHIKDITLKVLADSDSIVMNLEGGAVDLVARVSTAQAAELGDDFEVLEGTMNLVQAMYLNNAVAPFDNEKVRQALCYAVNKQEILDFVSEGKGTPVGSSMFPAFGKYYVEELNDIYTTDIDKAKALLADAGYADGFSFTMKVPSNYQQHVDTAQVVAEQLKQINVTANIELIEWETWLSDVYQGRDFEATLVGVDASTLTAGAMLSRFRSDAHNNFINFNNEEYDAAYEEALAAEAVMDDDKATEAYKKCETILAETAANVYIQDMCELVAVRKGYTGYTFYPLYIQDFSKLDVQ